ncbi:MAG: HAD family hydrolase [Candidatus Heimdallarchaeota archaeon]|nr:HAD family hydrolase [Candidatus Heimdallarchaeota archaeon]
MKFEAVLFDADETIFNNQGIHEIVVEQILKDLGLSTTLVNSLHSLWDSHYFTEQDKLIKETGYCVDRETNARSLVTALKEFDVSITLKDAKKYWSYMIREYSVKSKPYPDVFELLNFLTKRNIKKAIVSNGDREIISLRLENSKIAHHFEFVIAPCEEYPLSKPNLEIFTESLALLKTSAEKTVFVGDNPHSDISGANQAGLFSVLIDRYGKATNLVGLQTPKLKINSFKEMIPLFD